MVLLRQFGIDHVPLGLEGATEDSISNFLRGCFKLIEGGLRLQGSDIGSREVKGGEFGHMVYIRIVNATDQHTNTAHGALLGQYSGAILP